MANPDCGISTQIRHTLLSIEEPNLTTSQLRIGQVSMGNGMSERAAAFSFALRLPHKH